MAVHSVMEDGERKMASRQLVRGPREMISRGDDETKPGLAPSAMSPDRTSRAGEARCAGIFVPKDAAPRYLHQLSNLVRLGPLRPSIRYAAHVLAPLVA